MSVSNLALNDFFNIPNALFRFKDPVSADATVSFDLHWSGPVTGSGPITTPGSTGELFMSQATMTWSASNSLGFSFTSNASGTTSVAAMTGRVSNGVFVG